MALRDKILRLLFSSAPLSDESFMGYLLRLAGLNRCPTPSWLLQEARIKNYVQAHVSFVFDDSLALSPLAALTGVDEGELRGHLYLPADGVRRKTGDYLVFGWPVSQYLIRPLHPKICPACLRESNHVRRIWELAPVTTCPLHNCLLLDECPGCRRRIPWVRGGVSVCRCGLDWRKHEPRKVEDSEVEVARRIHLLCNLPVAARTPDDLKSDNPLYGLGLQPLISSLIFVASQFAGAAKEKGQRIIDTKGKHFAASKRNAEIHALLCKALPVFSKWPENYYSFLDARREQKKRNGYAPIKGNYFGEYKSALFVQLASSDFEFMRKAFREYRRIRRYESYLANGGIAIGIDEFTNRPTSPAQVNHISIPELPNQKVSELYETHVSGIKAVRALKTTWPGLEGLIAAGRLKAIVGSRGKDRVFFIEKDGLETLKAKLEQSLFLKQAEDLSGLPAGRIKELVECGLLNPLRGPGVDGCGDWRFDRAEIARLIDRLAAKAPRNRKKNRRGTISFMSVLARIGGAGISLGTFLQAVLDEEVMPAGRDEGIGLRCLLFSESRISQYIRGEYRLLVGDAMTLAETAKSLGVTRGTVDSLANKGFLRAEKFESTPSLGRLVKREELDAFNRNFILAGKLASEHGTSSNHLMNALSTQGVHPVMGRKADGSRTHLFKKADVAPLDIAALIAEERKNRLIILKSARKESRNATDSKMKKKPKPKRRYYKPPPILNETQAAEILEMDVETVRRLAEGGALKPHNRLLGNKQKGGGYRFSSYAVEKYKNRSVEHAGLVIFANAAATLNLWPDNFYNRYVKTGRIKPALNEGRRGDHYFRLVELEALMEVEKQTIITPEAAEILGVNVSCVDKMIAAGVLVPISGPKVDGFGKNLFLRSDVEKLRDVREEFKVRQVEKGKTSRFGRPTTHAALCRA